MRQPSDMKDYREIAKELRLENRHLKKELGALRADFNNVVSSKSWRITSPLRSFFRMLRIVRTAVKWKKFVLKPVTGRHIKQHKSNFLPDGVSPWLELVPEKGNPQGGWIELSLSVKSEQKYLTFYLVPSIRKGSWESSLRAIIPIESGKDNIILIKLPEMISGLRLEFYNIDRAVSFETISLKEIGNLQVFLRQLFSKILPILQNPTSLPTKLKTAAVLYRQGGYTALRQKFSPNLGFKDYTNWTRKFDTITDTHLTSFHREVADFSFKPLISVIMPVYNTPEKWLKKAINSVIAQIYDNWELCIVDDGSTDTTVRQTLQEYQSHPNIHIKYRQSNGHISQASNDAVAMAKGEYIAILDHDDELRPHSLFEVVKILQTAPSAKLIYSDEDKITVKGERINPYFKPDLNIELLRSQNYICHLTVIKKDCIISVGGFRGEVNGAQDWDLFLRIIDSISTEEVVHIPKILYHWRIIESSTANSTAAKPYVLKAQQTCVQEHLKRNKIDGKAQILHDISQIKVNYSFSESTALTVSIIIPTKDQVHHLKRCIKSIETKTLIKKYEIIIINNNSEEESTFEYFQQLSTHPNIKIVDDSRPFNFSQLNNSAAKLARGQYLLFLNNDIEVITKGWLTEMLSLLQQDHVGAIGAKLLFPNGLLQHAGVILGIGGVAGHNHKGIRRDNPGYFNRVALRSEFSAVTAACLLCKKEVFANIGGFNENSLSVAFNDVDLCLRIRQAGYRIIYTPYAELYHYESVSRGYENTPSKFRRFEKETLYMKQNWQAILNDDPCYNPNLTLLNEDFSLAYPPRQRSTHMLSTKTSKAPSKTA